MTDIQHHFAVRFPDLAAFPREFGEKIAVHGLHLKTQKPVQLGEPLALQFRFPQREDPLTATGIVAWVAQEADATGKRAIIAKKVELDKAAQALLANLTQSAEVQPPVATAAPLPPLPSRPAPQPTFVAADLDSETHLSEPTDNRKKRAFVIGGSIGLILLLLLLWLFALGGMRFIKIRWFTPPAAQNMAYGNTSATGVELPVPFVEAPVVKAPPATAVGFDYFQRPTVNEFIVTFNRPIEKIVSSRTKTPLVHTLYIEDARVDLDREQYFLPFDLVRTVTFEVDGGTLRISFVSQNPHYLPEPSYDIRGRELTIKFIATD